MIHRALSSLPTRPVLVIAPLVVLAVLAVHFYMLREECTGQAGLRESFLQSVAARAGGEYLLSDFIGFPWEHVKGFTAFKPQHRKRDCPFGWDWSESERQAIIDAGQLSVLIFFNGGAVAGFIEFPSTRLAIEEFGEALTPETARFTVTRGASGQAGYSLTIRR